TDTLKLFPQLNGGCSGAEAAYVSGPTFFAGAWYAAVADGSYYSQYGRDGYINGCDVTLDTAAQAGPQANPSFTGGTALFHSLQVQSGLGKLENEMGTALTLDGSETITICTSADCGTTETPRHAQFSGSKWYVASLTTGQKWVRIAKPGYVLQTDTAPITVSRTAMVSPALTVSGGDSLQYTVKLTRVEDELGNSISMGSLDQLSFYTTAGCSGVAVATLQQLYVGGPNAAWYAGLPDGSYYAEYRKSGFVDACDSSPIFVGSSTGQGVPSFQSVVGDSLKYGLKVLLYNDAGRAITNATLLHGTTSPVYANQGASGNTYYFNTTGAAALKVSRTGYETIDPAVTANSVEPGGNDVGQTALTLMGNIYGAIGTVAATAAGTSKTANGLVSVNNVEITVKRGDTNAGITGLGNIANFYFINSTGDRITPEIFDEVDSIGQPGIYQFKVDTTAFTLQIKNVDWDDDPWTDAIDSDVISLAGLDSSLHYYSSTMYPAADYIGLSTNSSMTAGATAAVAITAFNNDGATITVGPAATLNVQFAMTGGSTSPASQKDIESTTLTSATSVTGTSDTTVTGKLVAGTANIVIKENIASGA
ncbi:MAG TPA: hypothetical protein PLQ76_08900, partial [bacterium]|nr:hypothetical protein [bacterium]